MNNNYLIDTHFHLDLTCDIETILGDAEKNNVISLLDIC